MLSQELDFTGDVCYTTPDLGWKEPIYAVMKMYHRIGCVIGDEKIHGLTKSKDHAEQVAKEIGGWIQETGWLGAGSF